MDEASAEPLKVGVLSFVGEFAVMFGESGTVVSTSTVRALLAGLVLLDESVAVAVIEWVPSTKAVAGVKL